MSDGNTSFLRAARAGNLDKVLEHLKNNIDINTCNANGLNALHLASKDGHIHVVSELLKRGAIVDSATKKGNTALHIASLAGQEEVVKLLLQHNASVNVQSQNGFTPLYMAAQENHDSVVRLLLANGANQSLATEDGFTPLAVAMQQGHDKVVAVLLESDTRGKVRLPALHIAAKKDDVKAATLLLENDHNPDVTSKSGFTPLHIASHYGNESIANLLIQKGADVNYAAKHNITPLHVAAKWGKTNMVALLLEKGANIESRTRDGLTPLHCAARSGHEQVVDMLLERGAPISAKTKNGLAPLHMAAQGEHVDAARILLYHRAPVDEVTVDYLTALHVAAHCGHVRVAKLLLDRNADANARALNGFTPLHIACKKNRIKVVELLLKHGASISATTESGLTPLHVASFMGCMNIVIYLLQHEAKVDVPTVRGETPLHLAARANQTDIIRILLRNNAQVDARAREQQTPLHIAARLGNVDIVMLLLQHGAQVDATTKDMYTALHIAAKEGQDEVAACLIENGAALDATTKKGFTPLHLAGKYGHIKVAQLLLQKGAAIDAQGKNGVTPLHVAGHYDHQNVALLLLEKGASPHATAKNGNTPLHIAARKNQMDIATTLLEYGAKANAESKAGFTPLHLSAQEGHTDMSALLLEHKAECDHQARNGLTPMHLCAQEDKVNVAQILVKNGADIEKTTKAGYTPLHVAAHFGQANMVRFLLQNGANVDASTGIGYTPLHQAAQQGHCHIVNLLLEHKANANAQTANGQTPLHIARKLGYISVLDSLKAITNETVSPTQTPQMEEKYRVVAPETMHETFMTDSEEEGDEDTVICNQHYQYLTADEMKSLGDDSLPIDVTRDERIDSNRMVQSTDSSGQPIQEDSISPQHVQVHTAAKPARENYVADNITVERHPQHVGFLVSFLVDARGGAMRGCRHSGVRIIVPALSASQPTRITCRYVKPQRTMHPPQLMEGEALASRVLELGPVGTKFIGPVVMEVPHFASLRGKEREIVILRSDNGETWREHTIDNSEEVIQDVLNECFEAEDINQLDELGGGRICRFVTYDFPQYFAVVSRIRQEVHAIGPEGGMVSSTVVPQVQAVFPQGALTKKIKVGLQAQPIEPELTAKLLGRGVAVSPIVTVEPRRRKFHKAITLSMPAPKAHSQGMINQYSGNAPTLRLLCSITGGPSRAQWEDVTGSTPLTFVNDCVSFTTTVSARFWLMDCRNISEATKMATELYREAIHVPFMAKFVVFAKRVDVNEARLRVFCMTDDKEDKTLEQQENFTEVAKSRDVEVLEGKSQYIEMAGNLVPITKSGEQLQLTFKGFRENRLPFSVRVKDLHADTIGRTLFMREPKVAKGEPPQQPICILNIVLPEKIIPDQLSQLAGSRELLSRNDQYNYLGDLRIVDISNLLNEDWVRLAPEIGFSQDEINSIKAQHPSSTAQQAQAMLRQFKMIKPNDQNILENGLRVIGRSDITQKCIKITSYIESSRLDPVERKHASLDSAYDETDIMKESESVEELVSQEDRRLQQMRERDELKYSAEEKIVEDSESDDENIRRSVAERREKIVKRLSIERQIPASTQKKEIVQEITEIKRKSLIEDKKAIHEEEIMLQMPTDNIIKSAVVSDQVMKLKTNKVETPDVSKTEFDKELQDKFKKTVKVLEDEEDDQDFAETTSKIAHDSVMTEKSVKTEEFVSRMEPTKSTIHEQITKISSIDESIPIPVVDLMDISEKIEKVVKTETIKKEETITTKKKDSFEEIEKTVLKESTLKEEKTKTEQITRKDDKSKKEDPTKRLSAEVQEMLKSKDEDLEHKLSKQKEKIEKHLQEAAEQVERTTVETEIFDSHQLIDDYFPKTYSDKPRESLTEAEFYKSIEETITKKMSEGLIQISEDILTSVSKDIPESQTPPPTPIDVQSQRDGRYESPDSIPEEVTDAVHKRDTHGITFAIDPTEEDLDMIRNEALTLVDSVLEQSVLIVSAQQCNDTYNSESDHYAITCDVNGIDMVKSPTIESLSGKSFDDNISVNEENIRITPCTSATNITTTPNNLQSAISLSSSNVEFHSSPNNRMIPHEFENDDTFEFNIEAVATKAPVTTVAVGQEIEYNDRHSSKEQDQENNRSVDKKYERIERKFERLSSQLEDLEETAISFDTEFENLLSKDDVSNLQSDFSKISWDESNSATTAADVGLGTPDNDLQDLPTEPPANQMITADSDAPKPTPRTTKTVDVVAATKEEHTMSETTTIEQTETRTIVEDVDFKQSKKFWESLDSEQAPPPIPKPRMQVKLSEDSQDSQKDSSSHGSKISSEQQVEYSETSSAHTSAIDDRCSREEDSEISDAKLEDEVCSRSEIEKSNEGDRSKRSKESDEQGDDTDNEDSEPEKKPQASFYIGESSSNIITKSTTDKREELAFDNQGYVESGGDEKVLHPTAKRLQDSECAEDSASECSDGKPSKVAFDLRPVEYEVEDTKPYVLSIDIPETDVDRSGEAKMFRQDSETRNDILETSTDQDDTDQTVDSKIPKEQIVSKTHCVEFVQITEIKSTNVTDIQEVGPKVSKSAEPESETNAKIEPKLELNLDKSELEASEKSFSKTDQKVVLSPIKSFKGFTTYQETSDGFKRTLLIDPSQVDQSMVDQTLDEVKESLDALEEELIEVVKDGKLIKESPSEFEFKVLPHIKYTAEPIQESYHEEIEKQEKLQTEDMPSISSTDESSSKEVIHRLKKEYKVDTLNRWSVPDVDHSSSGDSHYQSFEKTDSRPVSSDIENLVTYGNSSEYQTALDASLLPESTEYVTAASTFDSSGKTISSHESMKSLDSESSANLGSIEVSEISETLVPSIADPDLDPDMPEEDFDVDDSEVKLSTLEDKFCGVLMEDYQITDEAQSQMKRSHEMNFQLSGTPESLHEKEDPQAIRFGTSVEEIKFPSSFEEGSVLSMSLSSASCIDTVVENAGDLAGSFGSSSLAGADILIRDDYAGTSFEEPSKIEKIDSMVMTSSMGVDDETNYANTQITTVTVSSTTVVESSDTETKRKGHRRNESTAFSSEFLKEMEKTKSTDSPIEEETPPIVEVEKPPRMGLDGRESGSESDYDAYESEYSRSFKAPTTQKKGKDKRVETFEKDQEPEKRPFTPSQSVSEIIVEDITTEEIETMKIEEIERRPSQNMHDYSNIPDITVTEDLQKYCEDDDEDFPDKNVLYKVKTQEELNKDDDTPIHYAQEQIYTVAEDQYEELIQRDYETKLADITTKFSPVAEDEEKADSPDSFEMLEQPDIADEFVIIEEVAKEANEFDPEGKSIKIQNIKYVKKHDEEVEKILVKSAPAAPNAGSTMFREDLNFEFEESPPTDPKDAEADSAAASKRWVEMQLSDNAAHLRYPYEIERGILEDIKEEDTDFEVGSSRISSFKDSFSSTPEYDVLAGRKYFSREHDNASVSSLQEFESLEQAISLENRKAHQGSQDSLSNGSFPKRYMARSAGQGDDISLSSLKEFEGLENACLEAHLIEIKAKEEAALLSRSDESNKSSNGDTKQSSNTVTTVTTVTTVQQRTSTDKIPARSQQEIDALLRAKLDECEEEMSNVMEVSTDSLELALKRKSQNGNSSGNGKDDSQLGSCDSLEINKSGEAMTSSIDSFEMSKDATARSSRSDVDSLEQQILQDVRRDSVDSIELEYALRMSKLEKDSAEEVPQSQSSSTTTTTYIQGPVQTVTRVTTITTSSTSGGSGATSEMIKDISSDSLNLNPAEAELLLSSTGSLDHTSSTATNATYQNENDSQMSSSMTSCGSNTMIDTLDGSYPDMYQSSGSSVTTTTTTSQITICGDESALQQLQQSQMFKDITGSGGTGEKHYECFEIYEKDSDKDTQRIPTAGESSKESQRSDKQTK